MDLEKQNYKKIFKDTLIFFIICCALFVPLVGVRLSGWKFSFRFFEAFTIIGALTIIKVLVSLINLSDRLRPIFKKIFSQRVYPPQIEKQANLKKSLIFILSLLAISSAIPFIAQQYILSVLITALIYVLLGLGLNIVIGFAGMLDLGYVAFYAVGAYSVALLHAYLNFDFWISLPIAVIISTIVGVILAFPILRMHGDYLAIVTLGFGEIIRLVMNNWTEVTRGPNGILLPRPFISFFGLPFSKDDPNSFHKFFGIDYSNNHKYIFIYFCLLLLVFLITFACLRLKKMPIGRSWEALREDETACRSLGINHVSTKLFAFGCGALIGGIGGAFFTALTEFVSPSSFTFIESALIVAIVVLGGLGSIPGVIIAAILMTILPEMLRDVANIRILMFSLVMIIMMLWRPRGLMKVLRPRFEKQKSR